MHVARASALILLIIGAWCCLSALPTPAQAPATSSAAGAKSYMGPGDAAVAGTPLAFWSCDFAMTASYAASNRLACNLVDVATRSVTYTMRFLANGQADWAAAMASTACAKSCTVSLMFDQVYVSTLPHPPSQPTQYAIPAHLAGPPFVFNGMGALPAMVLDGTTDNTMEAEMAATQFQPYSLAWVGDGYDKRGAVLAIDHSGIRLGFDVDPTGVEILAGTYFQTSACSDAKLHAFIAVFSGSSSVIRCDAAETTHDAGNNHVAANDTLTFFSSYGLLYKGRFGEAGYWGSELTAAQRASLAANMKSRYGL